MTNPLRVWALWAAAVTLTLLGVDIIQIHERNSIEEFAGYLLVGFGLLAMLNCGKEAAR